jgi:hypothetical protein
MKGRKSAHIYSRELGKREGVHRVLFFLVFARNMKSGAHFRESEVTLMASAPNSNNPLELFELASEKNGWQTADIENDETTKAVALEGNHGEFVTLFEWNEAYGHAMFRFVFLAPPIMPDWALVGTYELVNLMNEKSVMGRWVYLSGNEDEASKNRISWQYEIPTTLIGDDGDMVIAEVLQNVVLTHDFFYPVVMSFFGAKPRLVAFNGQLMFWDFGLRPEDAIDLLVLTNLFGRA